MSKYPSLFLLNYSAIPVFFLLIITLTGCSGEWKGYGIDGISSSYVYSGSATLRWQPPSKNVDGTPSTDISGYVIYHGYSSGDYTNWVDVGNVTSYTITDLPRGVRFFALTAYDTMGTESDFSNELSKVIQ